MFKLLSHNMFAIKCQIEIFYMYEYKILSRHSLARHHIRNVRSCAWIKTCRKIPQMCAFVIISYITSYQIPAKRMKYSVERQFVAYQFRPLPIINRKFRFETRLPSKLYVICGVINNTSTGRLWQNHNISKCLFRLESWTLNCSYPKEIHKKQSTERKLHYWTEIFMILRTFDMI